MPYSSFNRVELHTKEVLVDFQNSRHDHGDGEILLHEHIIQIEGLLNVLPIVVAVIPNVELSVKWKTFLGMIFFLHGKKNFEFLVGGWAKFLLEISEELKQQLNGHLRISVWWECAHINDTLCVLDHLDLSLVVAPGVITKQGRNPAAKVEDLAENGNVDGQSVLVTLESLSTCFWVFGEFELSGIIRKQEYNNNTKYLRLGRCPVSCR